MPNLELFASIQPATIERIDHLAKFYSRSPIVLLAFLIEGLRTSGRPITWREIHAKLIDFEVRPAAAGRQALADFVSRATDGL